MEKFRETWSGFIPIEKVYLSRRRSTDCQCEGGSVCNVVGHCLVNSVEHKSRKGDGTSRATLKVPRDLTIQT